MPFNLVVLGSTGSIGRQTLDVVSQFEDRINVYALTAGMNVDLLTRQATRFRPAAVSVGPGARTPTVPGVDVVPAEALADLVRRPEVDQVVVATSGTGSLLPTLAALEAGKLVALANKEVLVSAGPLIRESASRGGGTLVPIDSEHSAIWQCVQGEPERSVERITLTASGGALRALSRGQLHDVTPDQALAHPTWAMGRKITIDSANLMNKGLEVLEATWLFDVPLEAVDVVLHPQSIVHSLVTFDDSSTKAQLGLPDMRLPIQYALSHPQRWPNALRRLDLGAAGQLTFAPIDLGRYPALGLALEAGRRGDTYPAVLCAADEVAVDAFLAGAVPFTRISEIVEQVMTSHTPCRISEVADILAAEEWARASAARLISV
jgi:1-deoxy-D-xylulose-5-phosphate reductoisomerase